MEGIAAALAGFFEGKTEISFASIGRARYFRETAFRRNVERWIENLVNASIDIAKILLASERLAIPHTYRETLLGLCSLPEFPPGDPEELAAFSKLRNLLSHEYLDLRYPSVEQFVHPAPPLFSRLAEVAGHFVERGREAIP